MGRYPLLPGEDFETLGKGDRRRVWRQDPLTRCDMGACQGSAGAQKCPGIPGARNKDHGKLIIPTVITAGLTSQRSYKALKVVPGI